MERQKDKILIVDDVELNRAILCELFAGDYEILEADNGKTAVDLMEQYHEEIAIVLMDIVMPHGRVGSSGNYERQRPD